MTLENEKSLMGNYSIGRTPLREVLLRFQGNGLIIRVPRGGTVVAPLDLSNLMHILEARLLEQLHDKSARVWYCLAGTGSDISFGKEN